MCVLVSSWQGRAGPLCGFGWKDDGVDGVILGLRHIFLGGQMVRLLFG